MDVDIELYKAWKTADNENRYMHVMSDLLAALKNGYISSLDFANAEYILGKIYE